MAPSLYSAHLKLGRAQTHLLDIHDVILSYRRGNPIRLIPDKDAQTGEYLQRVRIEQKPPDRIGLIIGDFVHNLRSSLDHIAWQLALKTATKPYKHTTFPIRLAPTGKESFESTKKGAMQSIAPTDQAVIEEFQPYRGPQRPEDHLLYLLDRLWNTDKHRTVAVVGMASLETIVSPPEGSVDVEVFSGPFDDGDILARSPAPFPLDRNNQLQSHVSITVIFGQETPVPRRLVRSLVGDMYHFVHDEVFPRFELLLT